ASGMAQVAAQDVQRAVDLRGAIAAPLQPGPQVLFLHAVVIGPLGPVAQVLVAQIVAEQRDHALLRRTFRFADPVHAPSPSNSAIIAERDPPYSRIARTASSASSTMAAGAFSMRLNVRARASTVRVWSHRITPWVEVPLPIKVTLNPFSRDAAPPWVIGATSSRPDALLKASADSTSTGRVPRIS